MNKKILYLDNLFLTSIALRRPTLYLLLFSLSACFDFSGEGSLKQKSGLKGIFAKYADSDSPMVSQSLALGSAMMTDLRAQLQVSGMSVAQVNVVLTSVEAELDVMVGSLAIPAGLRLARLRLAGESDLTAFDLVGEAIIAGAMKGLAQAIGNTGKDEEKAYYTKVSVGSAFESLQQQASAEDKSVLEKAASLMIASAVQNISSMNMEGSSAGEGIKAITEGAVGSVMLRSGDENSGSQDLAQSIMKATVAELASVDFEGVDKSEIVKNATLGAINAVSRSDTKNEKGAQFVGVLAEASMSGMSAWKNNSETDTLSSIKAITEGAVAGLERALGKTTDISSALSEISSKSISALGATGFSADMVEKSAAAATSGAISGLNQVGVAEKKNHSENGSLAAIMQGAMSALSNDKTIDSARLATMTASVVNSAVSSLANMKMSDSSATQTAVGEIIKGSVKGLVNTSSSSSTTNSSMVGKIAEAATTALPAAGFSQAQIQKATEFVVATGVKSAIDSGVAKSSNISTIVSEISAGTVKALDNLVTTGAVSQSTADKSVTSFQTTIVTTVQTATQSGSIKISDSSLESLSTTISTAVTATQNEIIEVKNSTNTTSTTTSPTTTTTAPTTTTTTASNTTTTESSNPPDTNSPPPTLPQVLDFYRFPAQLNIGESIEPILAKGFTEISTCTVNTPLPIGLSLQSNCVITGIPTTAVPEKNYIFSAKNSENLTITTSMRGLAVSPNNYRSSSIRLNELRLGKDANFTSDIQFQYPNDTGQLNFHIKLEDAQQFGYSSQDAEVIVVFKNLEKNFLVPRKLTSVIDYDVFFEINESLSLNNSFPPGSYIIEHLFVKNKFLEKRRFDNEELTYLFSNRLLTFQVLASQVDNSPPELVQIGAGNQSMLDFDIYDLETGGTLSNLEFSFLDNLAMPNNVIYPHYIDSFEEPYLLKIELEHENTKQKKHITFNAIPTLSNEGKLANYNLTISFSNKEPAGIWRILTLYAYDRAFNRFQYNALTNSDSSLAAKIPRLNIKRISTSLDTAPVLNKFRLANNKIKISPQKQEMLQAYIKLTDDASFVPYSFGGSSSPESLILAKAIYQHSADPGKKIELQSKIEDKLNCTTSEPYECSLSMDVELNAKDFTTGGYGSYHLIAVELYDRAGNKTIVNSLGSNCTQDSIIDCASNSFDLISMPSQPINDLQAKISDNELSPLAVKDFIYDHQRDISYIATDAGLAISSSYGKKNQWLTVSNGLPSQRVTAILKIGDAFIIGTDAGLAMSNDNGMTFDVPSILLGKAIRKIVVNSGNSQTPILILTEKNGVFKFQQGNPPQFASLNNNPLSVSGAQFILDIQVDLSGNLYLLSNNGIHRFSSGSYDTTPVTISKSTLGLPNSLYAFHVSEAGGVFVSTSMSQNEIMYRSDFDLQTSFTYLNVTGFPANSYIKSIISHGTSLFIIHHSLESGYYGGQDSFSIMNTGDLNNVMTYSLQSNNQLGSLRINKMSILQNMFLFASSQGLKRTSIQGYEDTQSNSSSIPKVQRLGYGINDIFLSQQNKLFITNQDGLLESSGFDISRLIRNQYLPQGAYFGIETFGQDDQIFYSNQQEIRRGYLGSSNTYYDSYARYECASNSGKIITAISNDQFFYACGGSSSGIHVFNLPDFTGYVQIGTGLQGITDLLYADNKLLIGLTNGIKVYDLTNSTLNSLDSTNVSPVIKFSQTSNGIFVVRNSGLFKFDQNLSTATLIVDRGFLGLSTLHILTSYTEAFGRQFIGTTSGVFESSNNFTNKVHYTNTQGLGSNFVSNLLALPNGDILVTTSSGISVLKPNY